MQKKNTINKQAEKILKFYKTLTKKTRIRKIPSQVTARLKEGYTVEDAKKIILYKYIMWWKIPKMKQYVNLTTLFRPSHFEEYLSQAEIDFEHQLMALYTTEKCLFWKKHANEPPPIYI